MIRLLLATLVLPIAFATHIPLPSHPPKGMSRAAFKMDLQNLKTSKQFDLSKLGIPLEKSLRFAESVDMGGGLLMMAAVSPKKVETLDAWYEKHLHGWKVIEHDKGELVRLVPNGTTKAEAASYERPMVTIAKCAGGSFELFPCGTTVRFYKPGKH